MSEPMHATPEDLEIARIRLREKELEVELEMKRLDKEIRLAELAAMKHEAQLTTRGSQKSQSDPDSGLVYSASTANEKLMSIVTNILHADVSLSFGNTLFSNSERITHESLLRAVNGCAVNSELIETLAKFSPADEGSIFIKW
jgi:hypothetical protein